MRTSLLGGIVLAVIFVNGWTDAANSIATVVHSGTLTFRKATALAAVCELLGLLTLSLFCPTVAETVYTMVDLGKDTSSALIALQSALLSIVLWATFAWRFGVPTSESHALLAGLTGASVAIQGDFSGISISAWGKVGIGLTLSTALGAILGRWAARKAAGIELSSSVSKHGEVVCAGAMAFLHGAQDGQKFLAIFLLLRTLSAGQTAHVFEVPLPLALLCSLVISLGVACGGRRIIHTITQGMDSLSPTQSFSVDIISILCLLSASLLGLPISTTHTRVSILFGAGSAVRLSRRKILTAFRLMSAWLITFPCCGLLAWILALQML